MFGKENSKLPMFETNKIKMRLLGSVTSKWNGQTAPSFLRARPRFKLSTLCWLQCKCCHRGWGCHVSNKRKTFGKEVISSHFKPFPWRETATVLRCDCSLRQSQYLFLFALEGLGDSGCCDSLQVARSVRKHKTNSKTPKRETCSQLVRKATERYYAKRSLPCPAFFCVIRHCRRRCRTRS